MQPRVEKTSSGQRRSKPTAVFRVTVPRAMARRISTDNLRHAQASRGRAGFFVDSVCSHKSEAAKRRAARLGERANGAQMGLAAEGTEEIPHELRAVDAATG